MFKIEFYSTADGTSELWDFLDGLQRKSAQNKDARIRVLYFYHKEDTYVLLHYFRKKTQKTPRREIIKAKAERDDRLSRKE